MAVFDGSSDSGEGVSLAFGGQSRDLALRIELVKVDGGP